MDVNSNFVIESRPLGTRLYTFNINNPLNLVSLLNLVRFKLSLYNMVPPKPASLDAISRFLTDFLPARRANMATKDNTNDHTELRMVGSAAPICANKHRHTEKGQEACIGGSSDNCWCQPLPGFCSVSAHLRQRAHEPQSGLARRSN